MTIKGVTSIATENILGALAGGVAGYLGAKKLLKVEKKMYLIGAALVGAVAGAIVQSKLKSKATIKPAITVKG